MTTPLIFDYLHYQEMLTDADAKLAKALLPPDWELRSEYQPQILAKMLATIESAGDQTIAQKIYFYYYI
jgi:hypothetical protein